MKKDLKRHLKKMDGAGLWRIPLGIIFIMVGVVGGFVPILQGWIFILLGVFLLFGEDALQKIKSKFNK